MSYAEIRKLRKKLRQIEKLERLDRELTEEESAKVISKQSTRLSLQQLTSGCVDEFSTCVLGEKSDISTSFSNDSYFEQALLNGVEEETNTTCDDQDEVCNSSVGASTLTSSGPSNTSQQTKACDKDTSQQTNAHGKDTLPQTKACDKDTSQQIKAHGKDTLPQTKACDKDTLPQTKARDKDTAKQTKAHDKDTLPQTKARDKDTSQQAKAHDKDTLPQTKARDKDTSQQAQARDSPSKLSKSSSTSENKRKQNVDLPAECKEKKSRDESAENKLKHSCDFFVDQLKGHEGAVRAVSMMDDYLVTGSQDTTVKVWSLSQGIELRSLGGHSQPVSAVYIISSSLSGQLVAQIRDNEDFENSSSFYEDAENDFLVLSAALDCTFRLWSLLSGVCIKSVYTFHPLTSVSFLDTCLLVICGSDGGKLEIWDPVNSSGPLESVLAHEEAISSIAVDGCCVYCGSFDGLVSVFEWRENRLSRLYESADAKLSNGSPVCHRQIHCVAVHNGTIYYGDDGMNIKALDWKTGVVSKLTNHTTEFGSTRGLSASNGFLVSSGYDLDNGIGYINVWSIPEGKYLYTLCDVQTAYIQCLASRCGRNGRLAIVTGGSELKTWTPAESSSLSSVTQGEVVKSIYVSRFDKEPRHSDIESDSDTDEETDSSSSGDDSALPWHQRDPVSTNNSWLSWCSLL